MKRSIVCVVCLFAFVGSWTTVCFAQEAQSTQTTAKDKKATKKKGKKKTSQKTGEDDFDWEEAETNTTEERTRLEKLY